MLRRIPARSLSNRASRRFASASSAGLVMVGWPRSKAIKWASSWFARPVPGAALGSVGHAVQPQSQIPISSFQLQHPYGRYIPRLGTVAEISAIPLRSGHTAWHAKDHISDHRSVGEPLQRRDDTAERQASIDSRLSDQSGSRGLDCADRANAACARPDGPHRGSAHADRSKPPRRSVEGRTVTAS